MDLQFKVLVGANAGQMIKVQGPKFFIGRAEDCHLRPRSDLISRHHCVFIVEDDYVAVRDFGSKNGTFVNGEQLHGEQELKSGDRIKAGPLEFEVCINIGLGGSKKPKVKSVKEAAARSAETVDSAEGIDDDISDWLADDDVSTATETRELTRDSKETQELTVESMDTTTNPLPEPEHAKRPDRKKEPGKLPPQPPTSDSTDEAAAEMLRKLRRFR